MHLALYCNRLSLESNLRRKGATAPFLAVEAVTYGKAKNVSAKGQFYSTTLTRSGSYREVIADLRCAFGHDISYKNIDQDASA
jgi:hypothetical protein